MTATLSADDRTVIDRDTRCRCIETITPPTSSAQLDQGNFPLLNRVCRTKCWMPVHTVGELQGGLEEAERLLGYTVTREAGTTSS